MERVQDPQSPGFYSRLFLVQKKSGSWRPVIDLKVFNTFLLKTTFKMETPAFIRNSIRPMHWGVSLDLEDAYFHVPIHPNFRKYLRFAFQGQVYQFWAMPFGLAIAPRVFTKLMAAVGAHLRVHGVLLLQYFDHWLLHQLDRQLLLRNLEFAWKELLSLGLLLNANKSDLIPSQDFTFVGMNFLTHLNRVRVSRQRVSDLIARVKWVLNQSHITAQDFLSLNGILSSVADFVLLGRLFLRPLQHYLSSLWVWSSGNLLARIPILPPLVPHLHWWLVEETLLAGVPLLPSQPSLHLITDAKQGRLGSSFGTTQSDSFRHVVPSGVSSAHQQPGNESCSISSHQFPGTSSGLLRDVVHRQHISCLLRSGSGRDTLTLPLPGDQGSAGPLSGSEHFPLSQTHTRSPQCPGRRSVSKTPATSFGVDSPSGSGQPDLFLSRSSPRRSVCNQGQQQITSVRKSSIRCSSMGSRRAFVRVGPTGRLRLSPTHSHSPDSGENQGERLPDSPCRPLVAQETLVQLNSRSPVRLPKRTSSQPRPSVPERQTSCGPRHVPLTRLAVIRRSLQKKCFSAQASAFIASARRKSTRVVNDARWKLFSEW